MMQFLLHITCSCILHAYVFLFTYSYYCELFWNFFYCLFLSPSLFFLRLSYLWHLSVNLLRLRTLFVLELLHLLILLLSLFSSVMMMLIRHSRRTFLDEEFIRNVKSFCRTLPTLAFPLSFTVGDGSHCVTSWSYVFSCLSRSFTPTCTELIVQYLSFSLAFEVRAFLSHRSWLRMCFGSLG